MNRTVKGMLGLLFVWAGLASGARADDGGAETHDGFFLRFKVGPGYASAKSDTDPSLKISGGAFHFRFDIGGALTENLILHGTLDSFSVFEPEIEYDSESGRIEDSSFDISGIGIGLSYYLMPSNLYVGLLLASVEDSITFDIYDEEIEAESDSGPHLTLNAGKEWWVSDNWGLGLGADLGVGRVPDGDDNFDNFTFSVNFSATYN